MGDTNPIASPVSSPILTITIPTYNRANFLLPFLKSIAAQLQADNLQDDVVVHVNDNASPDSTQADVQAFRAANPWMRITYARLPKTVSPDQNGILSVGAVKTPWTWIMADDDAFTPGAIAFVTSRIRALSPDISFMTIQHDVYNSDLTQLMMKISGVIHGDHVFTGLSPQITPLLGQYVFMGKHIFRTQKWEQTENMQKYADSRLLLLYFIFYWLSKGEKVAFYDRLCVLQRYNNSQMGEQDVFEIFWGVLHHIPTMIYEVSQSEEQRRHMLDATFHRFALLSYKKAEPSGILPSARDWQLFNEARKFHGHDWRFWLFYPPQLVMPPDLTRALKPVYDWVRTIRHRGPAAKKE